MKRILLTGGGGSIGIHFVAHFMHNTDWEIVILDSFRHKGSKDKITEIFRNHQEWRKRIKVIQTDLVCPISPEMKKSIGNINYILHLAAMSDVLLSVENPAYVVRNNIESTITLLEYAKHTPHEAFIYFSTDEVYGPVKKGSAHKEWDTHRPSNAYSASKAACEDISYPYWRKGEVNLVITNCFSMDTKIMTTKGLKGYDEITVGDNVWTLDEDEKLNTTTILEKIKMESSGEMVAIKGDKINQLITPNHRLFVKIPKGKPTRYGELVETTAEKVIGTKKRLRIPRTGEWEDINILHPKYILGEADEEIMAAIYGWYVSEGYTASKNTVCFGASSKKQQKIIQNLLSSIGNNYVNGRSVRIHNQKLFDIVNSFGHKAKNKLLPDFIKELSGNTLRAFFDAAISGDGSRYPSALVYYTKSKQLAEDMLEIGMKMGYGVRLSKRMTQNPNKTRWGESFIVRFSSPNVDIIDKQIKRVPYYGDVWCVRTKVGRVFIERGGVISLSGQTMNNFGEMQIPSKFPVIIQKKVEAGEVVIIHGNKKEIGSRFYLHSRNAADAVLHILKNKPPHKHKMGEIDDPDRYHIVGEVNLNNLQLAQHIAKLMGKELKYKLVDFHRKNPAHDIHYGLEDNKLRKSGWKQPINFEDSMKSTIKWQQQNKEWVE